jgi:hypothetical protein
MKHLILTTLLLLSTFCAFAQITINAGDLPVIGLVVEQGIDTMPESNLQPGGTGLQTWDFSDLEDHETDQIYFRSPQGLPFAGQFPGATIAVDDDNNFYQYLKLSSQVLQILGVGGNFQVDDSTSFALSAAFTPPQTLLQLPATYNQNFDENIRQVLQWPLGVFFDSIRIVANTHRVVKIDAYGLVTTPAGEFNTLRVKEHASTIDSTFGYTGGLWFLLDAPTQPDTSVNFGWWGKINGYAFPLVEFDMDPNDLEGHVQSASWVKSLSTGTGEQLLQTDWRLYPNPAHEFVNIEWPEDLNGGLIQVYDMQGRLMVEKNIADQPEWLPLRSLQPNTYVVVLKDGQGRVAGVKKLGVW